MLFCSTLHVLESCSIQQEHGMGAKKLMIFNNPVVECSTFIAASLCLMRYRHSPLHISVQYMLQDKQTWCAAVWRGPDSQWYRLEKEGLVEPKIFRNYTLILCKYLRNPKVGIQQFFDCFAFWNQKVSSFKAGVDWAPLRTHPCSCGGLSVNQLRPPTQRKTHSSPVSCALLLSAWLTVRAAGTQGLTRGTVVFIPLLNSYYPDEIITANKTP